MAIGKNQYKPDYALSPGWVLVYWAIVAIGLLGIEKSFAQDGTKPPTFGHVGTVPPEEAVLTAIDLMRLEIERFQFELPNRHELRFRRYFYENGKERTKIIGRSGFIASSGMNELVLVKYKGYSALDSFAYYMEGDLLYSDNLFGSDRDSDDTRYYTAEHPFTVGELAIGKKTPLYVYASDPDHVTELGSVETENRIKQYIKENKWVYVVYVELH